MNNKIIVLFLLLAAACTAACSKGGGGGETPPPVNPPAETSPAITAIAPDNGVYNTVVNITGSNFSTTLSENEVKFNGKPAKLTAATATRLMAEVPKGAGTGPVTVTVKSKTATGPAFNYTYTLLVSTLAGSTRGYQDGTGAAAKFSGPRGIAIDQQGNLYVADHYNNRVRKVTLTGVVTTLAGSEQGYQDGVGTAAKFWTPHGICTDPQGNIYVTDGANEKIRKITPAGVVSTFAGTTTGYQDGLPGEAKFFGPEEVCSDAQGNIYVGDASNNKIRKITPAGYVSTLAGSTWGYLDGTGTAAKFYTPRSMVCDPQGNLYVSDYFNTKIRKVTPAGVVTTFAGSESGYLDGPAATAKFDGPRGLLLDAQGNLFLVEDRSNTLRKITPAGIVSTLAGRPELAFAGYQDGAASVAKFATPSDICADAQGNLYIADFNNDRIRKISFE